MSNSGYNVGEKMCTFLVHIICMYNMMYIYIYVCARAPSSSQQKRSVFIYR